MNRATRRRPWRRTLLHLAQVESLEPRQLLAAEPIGDFFLDHGESEQLVGEIHTTLANAHALTGLDVARTAYGFTGLGQTVAVIDSGVAYDHAALGGGLGASYRVVGGWDFTEENDADPYDDAPSGSHGTHVAGIVGSSDSTHTGVAPGVDLVALRVFNDQGAGYFSWVEQALDWVHDHRNDFAHPITAVNLSLGTEWNSDSIPGWAMLENEFAQLEADGIFIAVAAGNAFTDYYEPGLSYPAASSYVVPVASVDDDGQMSYFSQRSDRVIAAPGRGVTSTVPDYDGNYNGQTDDFRAKSGTSMASPYAAGASVLIRQAMQLVGMTGITQDAIYDVMRDTADDVWDAATAHTYRRLNLQAALDSLMPADDFGSTEEAAHGLGTLSGTSSVAGMLGRLDDADYFTFTAGATGTATFSADFTTPAGNGTAALARSGGPADFDGGELSFEVYAGQSYTVSVAADGELGYYDLNVEIEESVIDLGWVDFSVLPGQYFGSPQTWYQMTAAHGGTFTVEAFFADAAGDVDLHVFTAGMQFLAASTSSTNNERLDFSATAGAVYLLRATGTNPDVDFRLTNLVSRTGSTVVVTGTGGDDTLEVLAGGGATPHHVIVNGVEYTYSAAAVDTVQFDGAAGADSIHVVGTAGDESATLQRHAVDVTGPGFAVHAVAVQSVLVEGNGGSDTAAMFDSPGNDRFVGQAGTATLFGSDFHNEVRGFGVVVADASAGGADIAQLYDTAGDDELVARDWQAILTGGGTSTEARHFDRVYAYATAGGNDRALLYDTAGNDRFIGRDWAAAMFGAGFYNEVQSFDVVEAFSTAGGVDYAQLYDSSGVDRYVARPSTAALSGAGFANHAHGFDRVYAYSTAGGADMAEFFDSAGNDQFVGRDWAAALFGSGFYNEAQRFERVYAHATAGGYDTAQLFDSAGNDVFVGRDWAAAMYGAGFYNEVRQFDRVVAVSTLGGADVARLYDSAGNDRLTASPTSAVLDGSGFRNEALHFERTYAYATGGGVDYAQLFDSAGDDRFIGRHYAAVLFGAGFYNEVRSFDRVYSYATAGGTDVAQLYDSAGSDTFVGRDWASALTGAGFYNEVQRFDQVLAYSTAGGNDVAYLYDSAGNDLLTATTAYAQLSGSGFFNHAAGFRTVRAYTSGGFDQAVFDQLGETSTLYGRDNFASILGADFDFGGYQFDLVTARTQTGHTSTADVQAIDYALDQQGDWV